MTYMQCSRVSDFVLYNGCLMEIFLYMEGVGQVAAANIIKLTHGSEWRTDETDPRVRMGN